MLEFLERSADYPVELKVWQVAAILGCTKETVRKYLRQGKLRGILMNGKYLIRRDDLLKYIEESIKIPP